MEGRDNESVGKQDCDGSVISTRSYSCTTSVDHLRSADRLLPLRPDAAGFIAGHLSNLRSWSIVAASALKKPLTIFSNSSPGTGSSSKFPFLASAIKPGSFNVA